MERDKTPGKTGEEVIKVHGLEKQYSGRPVKAVDGIDFSLSRGEVFGLLGPNGAGKTTTIGVLTTRVLPTGGQALVTGIDVLKDPVAVKPRIAVVPQRNNLDRSLNALENLTFHAAYFGIGRAERIQRARAILEQFGLGQRAKDQVATYSGGMAQRLLIARSLMHDPQILFLDEPTTGLDPQSRLFLWDTIRSLHAKGLTILLTTHDMEEAETLCNRVAIMDHGKILALDTPANLSRLVPAGTRVELHTQHSNGDAPNEEVKAAILSKVKELDGVTSAEWTAAAVGNNASPPAGPPGMFPGGRGAMPDFVAAKLAAQKPNKPKPESMLRLYAQNAGELAVRAAQIVLNGGLELADMHLARPSLEDVFIHLTGRGLRD